MKIKNIFILGGMLIGFCVFLVNMKVNGFNPFPDLHPAIGAMIIGIPVNIIGCLIIGYVFWDEGQRLQ